jgi:outer membrane receptor for ferrienterochelin and colicin
MTRLTKRLLQITPILLLLLFAVNSNAQTSSVEEPTKEEIEKAKASGVKEIIVETKEEAVGKEKPIGVLGEADRPSLFIVDGKEFDPNMLNTIDPATIEKQEILKGKKAKQLYGDKAKKGVVVITLKKQ